VSAADELAWLAWLHTAAAAAAAMLGCMLIETLRDKAATSLGAASGVVAGLVTITPAAGALTPMTSLILGFVGGILGCLGVGLKFKFGFDDSLDVVGVHLVAGLRSEEHTSELQSRFDLVCRLLLEKKNHHT